MTEEKSFYSTDHSETIRPANKAGVSLILQQHMKWN